MVTDLEIWPSAAVPKAPPLERFTKWYSRELGRFLEG
jgi:hypothetical protein